MKGGIANSAILSDEFARGAQEAGCQVEKIQIQRKHVAGCLGCNACYRNNGECVQKDDMQEIREKMIAANDESFTETMKAALRGFTSCVPESVEGGIVLGIDTSEPGDVKKKDAFVKAYEMGKAII